MGNFFVLWKYDGHFIYLGTERISRAVCVEKVARLYSYCCYYILDPQTTEFLDGQFFIWLYNRLGFIIAFCMVFGSGRKKRVCKITGGREVFKIMIPGSF